MVANGSVMDPQSSMGSISAERGKDERRQECGDGVKYRPISSHVVCHLFINILVINKWRASDMSHGGVC